MIPPGDPLDPAAVAGDIDRQRWVAYELLVHHPDAPDHLGVAEVERLGRDGRLGVGGRLRLRGLGTGLAAGAPPGRGRPPLGGLPRPVVAPGRAGLDGAAESPVQGRDRPTERTLDICRRLAADGDDMVVKALSWALRELVVWDPEAVRRFLDAHHRVLAARVRREVRSKLETGREHPARRAT